MSDLFDGVFPVMNTPFLDNGDIDLPGVRSTVEYCIAEGCEQISIFALNSEPNKLTNGEKLEVLRAFHDAAKGRVQTAVGVIESSIRGAIEFAGLARESGADGIILFPPMIAPPAGEKLFAYLDTVCSAVSMPVMYQDAPRTTSVTVTTDFLLDCIRRIPNLKHVKVECVNPVLRLAALKSAMGDGVKCHTGNGGIYTVDGFVRGADGVMPGVANVGHFVALYDSFRAGDLDTARAIFENMMPLLWFEDQSLEFFVASEKEILKRKGVIGSAHVRAPGMMLDAPNRAELFTLVDRLKPAR